MSLFQFHSSVKVRLKHGKKYRGRADSQVPKFPFHSRVFEKLKHGEK